jgi:HTH-type transcriptional repressor of NAD biosynthesis genes
MKRGLVIGKFMPLHAGHIALIRFAATQCDELIVSMSYTPGDPIDPALRFGWVRTVFADAPNIRTFRVLDDFDNESLSLPQRTMIWADFIRRTYPTIDVLFSSEEYREPFAGNLGAQHIVFDQARVQLPVSATLIRQNPFRYWDFIPTVVRPYYVKKICFFGAESTGKSSLAKRMAELYQTEFVPEVARELLVSNDFSLDDIIRIGYAQLERIREKEKIANKLLFCDTDTITTQIYSQHYLHTIPPVLFEIEKMVHYDLYFLLDIDVPWVADGLRDLGHQRREMFNIFKEALEQRGIPYVFISGSFEERDVSVRAAIDRLLQP